MALYTKTGDAGETSLFGGSRVSKDSLKVWSYGTVDEVVSFVGVARAHLVSGGYKTQAQALLTIQQRLFTVGAQLSSDAKGNAMLTDKINEQDITYLENIVDQFTQTYGKLTAFIVPGDTIPSSFLHTARTATRRAERHIVALAKEDSTVDPTLIKYINRLSDALFAMAIEIDNLTT